MTTVQGKYLKDETNNTISPIVNINTIYDNNGNPMGGGIVPVGSILPYVGETAPSNYLICDGSTVSTDDYPLLSSVVPSGWISGSGINFTLTLPDLRKRVIIGKVKNDSTYGTIGKIGGEETHTLTIEELARHYHKFIDDNSIEYPVIATMVSGGTHEMAQISDSTTHRTYKNMYTQWVGNNEPHNNMQPYIVLNYIIRAK